MEKGTDDARVEPLIAALREGSTLMPDEETQSSGRRGLGWKLFWAAVVFLALLALVLEQSF